MRSPYICYEQKKKTEMENLTFDKLPQAVAELSAKIDQLAARLSLAEPEENDTLDVEGAMRLLKKSRATIYQMTHTGTIPHFKIKNGNKLYFSKKELTDLIKAGRVRTRDEIAAGAMDMIAKGGRK